MAAVALLLLFCGGPARAHGPRHHPRKHRVARQTWHFPGGLVVTSLPTPPGDLAELVDAHLYKFRLHFTGPNAGYTCRLEWRASGQPPRVITSGGVGAGRGNVSDYIVKIGLVPLGLDFEHSSQFKWTLFDYWRYNGGTDSGGTHGYEDDPYKSFCFDIVDNGGSADGPGTIPLMKGSTTDTPPFDYAHETRLVLVVAANPKP